ncbi:polyketide beta-ketoacyl-synthase [Diplodia intermedia]|uniref:Polyketide beta-ketoacyl-synthase n=1 Tax=Diplodia intermedia TaxID=856260 RepID=A0ABR3TBP2_9PEZI
MLSGDIILFAGQGAALSSGPASKSSSSATATRFLKACHDAFLAELSSLSASERTSVGDIEKAFPSPNSLLDPSATTSPVVEGITLYIQQILEYISYATDGTAGPSRLAETAGFCSGILPAVIVSLCPYPDSQSFLDISTEGFRLAFWIGLRSSLFCRNLAGDSGADLPWSLTVQGLTVVELEELLREYNSTAHPRLPLRISAILSERVVSLCGEGQTLEEFKSKQLPSSASSRFANIHGYYHGGDNLQETLETVMQDAQRRAIRMPSWEALQVPVRSTLDGKFLDTNRSADSLLKVVLGNYFTGRVDWDTTSEVLIRETVERLTRDPKLRYNILALGPNSRSLLRAFNTAPTHPKLRIGDLHSAADGPSPDDIAIVGMSVNYPSGKGPEQLWETMEKGLNVVREVPSSRFQVSDYYSTDPKNKDSRKMNSKYGNFLDDPFAFDNTFFQISPREAKSMDPQQRLLLHAAFEAMEDAGYAPDATPSFQKETMGAYMGVATLDYVDNTRNDIDVYYSPGTLRAFLSGRISYAFQLKGPSVVIDTACSSSTVALYQACRALQAGDCTSALAGGVNVISSPDMYMGLSRAHFLSPTGQCKPWDASADGYCRGEGCGMFVLKKLSDAVAEGDRVYGVIRGIEVNQCGTAKSITHPDAETQALLFKSMLTKTKIHPDTISVVEAHGTGTQAGDYAEVNSLQAAFGSARAPNNPLILSSIKGNIGHAEAASGAAGLAKLLLMMQKQRILPQAAYQTLNPRLASIAAHNIVVPTQATKWATPTPGAPRRALLNNFGAAGSNAALIVEEYPQQQPTALRSRPAPAAARSAHVLTLSAKSADALERLRLAYCASLDAADAAAASPAHSAAALASICYTANARRQAFAAFRLAVTGSTLSDVSQKLRQQSQPPARGSNTTDHLPVFVFSGQGAVYPGMGAELLGTSAAPAFRDAVRECNDALAAAGFPTVDALLLGEEDAGKALDETDRIVVAQCACFVVEYALAALWRACGVAPAAVVGHSLGEYAALATAGVLAPRDAVVLVARRARLMAERCGARGVSGMAACNMAPARAEAFVKQNVAAADGAGGVTVACKNSTDDCVVAGPVPALEAFVRACKGAGVKAKLLDVPYGFHSEAMDPMLDEFAQLAAGVEIGAPQMPVVSSYLGRLVAEGDIDAGYFVNHARQPVEFVGAVQAVAKMAGERQMTLLEIGPAPITLPMFKATLKQTDATLLPSMKSTEKPWVTLSAALKTLFLQRHSIQWSQVYAGSGAQFVPDLPRYPLSPSTFVVPFKETTAAPKMEQSAPAPRSIYRFQDGSQIPSPDRRVFGSKISALADFIKAHNVGGAPLCPASVYIELAMEAQDMAVPDLQTHKFRTLTNMTFDKPLVYSENNDMDIHTELMPDGSSFRVLSEGGNLHCTGAAPPAADDATSKDFARRTSYIKRQRGSVVFADTFSSRILYDVIFPRVVGYSGPYVSIKALSIAASGLEGAGTFELPRWAGRAPNDGFVCPPAFTDTLLHAAGFVANSKINADEACICVKVERITVPSAQNAEASGLYGRELGVYCGLVDCDDTIIGDAYALDAAGNVVACVEGMHFKRLRLKSFQAHLARVLKPSAPVAHHHQRASPPAKGMVSAVNFVPPSPPRTPPPAKGPARTSVQATIRPVLSNALSELCGISGPVDDSARLSEMGVDSLLFIELTGEMQKQFPHLGLSSSAFSNCETVSDMEKVIQTAAAAVAGPSTPPPQLEMKMPEMPDMKKMPFTPPSTHGTTTPSVDVERVDDFFKEVCGFSLGEVDDSTTLDALGIDSLLSIELTTGLRQTFGVELDESSFADLSIGQLQAEILAKLAPPPPAPSAKAVTQQHQAVAAAAANDDHHDSGSDMTALLGMDTFPVHLQKSSAAAKKPALYLFHDGSGLCTSYARLGAANPAASPARDIYAAFAPDFALLNPAITTLEDMAARYIRDARLLDRATTDAPIVLGGWSFGGVLAFEIARQLRRQLPQSPRAVAGVVLIDSPHPVGHVPLPDEIIAYVSSSGGNSNNSAAKPSKAVADIRAAVAKQFRRNAALLGAYAPADADGIRCVMLMCKGGFDAEALCGVEYAWLSDEAARRESVRVWEGLLGREVPVLEVEGNHFDLFERGNVESVAVQLEKAVRLLEVDG